MKKILAKQMIALMILGLFLCAILLEIGLRIGGSVFLSLQEYRNRTSIKQKGTYKIMCLGESTTALGGENSYPRQLEEILNQQDIGIKFGVINKGMPATNTENIVLLLPYTLEKYNPDMVITMMSENDLRLGIGNINSPFVKNTAFFKRFKTYKLAKLLWLSIMNKVQIPRSYRIGEKEETITVKIDDLFSPCTYKELEEKLKKSIEINPQNNEAYIFLGRCYMDEGKHDQAQEMFIKAIEIDPESDEAYTDLGWCYKNQAKYDQAKRMFKKAIEINPENCRTYIDLGWWYSNHGEHNKAEEIFKKIIRSLPSDDRIYGKLAVYYQEQKKYKLADEYFRKASKLRLENYGLVTRQNYQRLKQIVTQKGITLVCVQYPMRNIGSLKNMLAPHKGVIFVDNEKVFKETLKQGNYNDYFTDDFGGDFGHATPKGNRILAQNIANVILKECFNYKPLQNSL